MVWTKAHEIKHTLPFFFKLFVHLLDILQIATVMFILIFNLKPMKFMKKFTAFGTFLLMYSICIGQTTTTLPASTSADPDGRIKLTTGTSTNGGNVTLQAGSFTTDYKQGGNITLQAGNISSYGAAGNITLNAGICGTNAGPGNIYLNAGTAGKLYFGNTDNYFDVATKGLRLTGTVNAAAYQINGAVVKMWNTAGSKIYYSGGNVGIATSDPQALLEIKGPENTHTQPALDVTGDVKFRSGYFDISRPAYTTAAARIAISSYTGPGGLRFVMSDDGSFSSAHSFDALFLAPNGNVGIGTTVPNAKLTVKGQIVCSKATVLEVTNIPDYVFDKDYKLMSLPEIECFVNEHKHLPEVPSAKEVEANGLDLVKMNLALLKRVEEMTLLMIEQNKEIKHLQAEVEILKK